MKKFDKTAITIILSSLCLLAVSIGYNNLRPFRIEYNDMINAPISPNGPITLEFTKAIDPQHFEALVDMEPSLDGRWEWENNRQAAWFPTDPLSPLEELEIIIRAGPVNSVGEALRNDLHFQVKVREPQIVFLKSTGDDKQEIFCISLDDEYNQKQLTVTNGNIADFTPSPDGESIIFSLENEHSGIDLWIMNRDGSNQQKLLDCSTDSCTGAVWSPNSQKIAYTREISISGSTDSKNASFIRILDISSGEISTLFEDAQMTGFSPTWSPDGQWLSIWNDREARLEIINLRDLSINILESNNCDSGCWSSDSSKLYFTNTTIGESTFMNIIQTADLFDGTIETILGGNQESSGLSYNQPICSPTENLIAVSIQPNINIAGKFLAVIDLDNGEKTTIMNDLSRIPGYYSWNPSGDFLLFQMTSIGKDIDTEIWLWEKGAGQIQLVLKEGKMPAWLP